jgi:hypothetical protein
MYTALLLLGNGLVHIIVAINTHAITEELLDTTFSMRSMSYQRKAGNTFSQNFFFMYHTPLQL